MGLRCASAILLATCATGCSTIGELNAGPVAVIGSGKEKTTAGAAFEAHAAIGTSSSQGNTLTGVDVTLRAKVAGSTQSIAFGEGFAIASHWPKAMVMVRAGGHLQFERYDDKLLVGGGPWAAVTGGYVLSSAQYFSPGVFVSETRRARTLLTFGPMVEVDARFSRPTATTFLGLTIGIAWADDPIPKPPEPAIPGPSPEEILSPEPPRPPPGPFMPPPPPRKPPTKPGEIQL